MCLKPTHQLASIPPLMNLNYFEYFSKKHLVPDLADISCVRAILSSASLTCSISTRNPSWSYKINSKENSFPGSRGTIKRGIGLGQGNVLVVTCASNRAFCGHLVWEHFVCQTSHFTKVTSHPECGKPKPWEIYRIN